MFAPVLCANAENERSRQLRPFTVEDIFELEDTGQYAFSADEKMLAFTRVRPKRTLTNYTWNLLGDDARSDVWVQVERDRSPMNITNAADGSGWWSPQWSPDSKKLAMLSTRGGNVRLWIWDVEKNLLRRVVERGLGQVDLGGRPYLWIDAERLLYPAVLNGEQTEAMRLESQASTAAVREWPKVAAGRQITASVVDGGIPAVSGDRPQNELLLVDVDNGSAKTVARGVTGYWQLSHHSQAIAFVRQLPDTPDPERPLSLDGPSRSTVEIVTLRGDPVSIRGDEPQYVRSGTLRWSPEGDVLAFLGYQDQQHLFPLLYRLDLNDLSITATELITDKQEAELSATRLEWGVGGDLMIFAMRPAQRLKPNATLREDWWLLKRNGALRCVTEAMRTVPSELRPLGRGSAFIGLLDGDLWKFKATEGRVENLTADFKPLISSIAWSSDNLAAAQQIVFSAREGIKQTSYFSDLLLGEVRRIPQPGVTGRIVAYAPHEKAVIIHASDRAGLFVWRSDLRRNSWQVLVAANEFLRDVEEAKFKQLDYTSLNGERLSGGLLLPILYEPGKRYPLVTWVYPGSVYGEQPSHFTVADSSNLNLQLVAARGYAVLLPSMPLGPEGSSDDPMLRLTEGVLPAVDEAIAVGIADPDRLFLMGHSFGGFAVYGLLTQTRRFAAAAALAGPANLVSFYGQFDPRKRYTPQPHDFMFAPALLESHIGRMGNAPWRELWRYLRNSPIFFVDRVHTPLLILQGDMDYVSIQQGEEFFTALHRQGKRSRFVRYWGEGHVIQSPANVRDLWDQVFTWFAADIHGG